jgi:hypothetical protein
LFATKASYYYLVREDAGGKPGLHACGMHTNDSHVDERVLSAPESRCPHGHRSVSSAPKNFEKQLTERTEDLRASAKRTWAAAHTTAACNACFIAAGRRRSQRRAMQKACCRCMNRSSPVAHSAITEADRTIPIQRDIKQIYLLNALKAHKFWRGWS